MDTDEGMPHTADYDEARQTIGPFSAALPFDHRVSANQNLTFEYAKPAFASAGIKWCDENRMLLHLFDVEKQATNTALLLSDQCPYLVKCAVFEGDTKTNLEERKNVSGSVLNQIDATMMFLNQHNLENAWPQTALRESLVNAVLHRDYDKNGPILISIFDSSIEIVSPGGLVDGFEVNDLLNGVSESRNYWLADVFEALHLSENYGTGVQRILDAYSQSLASPQLRVGPGSVAMILPKPVLDSELPEPHLADDSTDDPESRTHNDGNNNPDNGSGKAKRYTFPLGGHLFTTIPAEALTGSRVLSATSLPSLIFASEKSWQSYTNTSQESPINHTAQITPSYDKSKPVGTESQQFKIESVDEMTMAFIAQRGTALSRKQIQTGLGTSEGQTSYVLKKLVNEGKLKQVGHSRATKYSLA
ncbi:ATP-binding protein [Bifidobacterium sp. ESL0732]|uniref:ATP-binding protein n=1 Tax=Bifidobacterium sp. ESL0732 TaxID=2983222 RepID=UPI0023F7DBDB|nr:ATP-binding protein [Bifidobacterium sp. ESL0732]WEV63467.1 transcriptional regulator [Bifidobacterium sp. ESL0732]